MIQVSEAGYSIRGRTILSRVSFEVAQGEMVGIIGPNGSGKSTLLRLLAGIERPHEGSVKLEGRQSREYPRKELARWLAVLQQDALPDVAFSVREVVEMGRYPFQNWLGREEADSALQVERILQRLQLSEIAERTVDRLSGGERQRVALAKVMAQQPRLLLLDEPTTYLDIGYQLQFMDHVRQWQREEGLTAVAVLHDLNLAAMYCDRLLVLHQGRIADAGLPADVLQSGRIEQVYGTLPLVVPHPENGAPQLLLRPGLPADKPEG
ncbi:heme ABC transporter ATP-binding protein [Paenibacillus sp. y28]|uniref:heme ABC transporter ATP-binding protein n=1 Tax=Paenibacillus sp. y28 TaxID=3129110 RepID=UPI00301AAD08